MYLLPLLSILLTLTLATALPFGFSIPLSARTPLTLESAISSVDPTTPDQSFRDSSRRHALQSLRDLIARDAFASSVAEAEAMAEGMPEAEAWDPTLPLPPWKGGDKYICKESWTMSPAAWADPNYRDHMERLPVRKDC